MHDLLEVLPYQQQYIISRMIRKNFESGRELED